VLTYFKEDVYLKIDTTIELLRYMSDDVVQKLAKNQKNVIIKEKNNILSILMFTKSKF
jgi:hypothetical protein